MNRDFDAGPRVRPNNFFDIGVVGRRTGITMKANVKKDADGLDNIDDFWDDEDNNSAADNIQNDAHDTEQDDFSGEDEPLASPSARKSDPRRYMEQEASHELLSTPTSRKSRGISMTRGTHSSDVHGSIQGSHLFGEAEDTPSPSFKNIRKRLVFTKDTSDNEAEQATPLRSRFNTTSASSPALDKILSDSQERQARMAFNASRDTSASSSKSTSAISTLASATLNVKAPSKAASTKAKQPITRPSKAPVPSRRPAGVVKAFNLGGDFDDQDDFALPNYNADANISGPEEEPERQQTPPRAAPTKAKASTTRTPAEFKRKSKAAPVPEIVQPIPSDDDGPVHDEPETRPEEDDRLRFSDEDGPSRVDDEEESEEEEALQDNRRKMKAPTQTKRTATTQEPKSVAKGGKRVAAGVTKSTAKKPETIPKQDETDDDDEEEVSGVSSEDDRQVPSMQSKSKGQAKAGSRGKKAAAKSTGDSKVRGVVTEEVPVVPEQSADVAGVRRSHRTKVAPLEFWKNEKLVYGAPEDNVGTVIKAVIRAKPEEPAQKLSAGVKRKRSPQSGAKAPPAKRTARKAEQDIVGQSDEPDEDSEEDPLDEDLKVAARRGLREEARKSAETIVYGSDDVVSRVVAESQSSIQFRNVQGGEYQFHRGLEDADSVVSGTMRIKPDGRKPVNSGSNSSMVFYVIQGLVQVNVHESQFVLSTGGRFLVPRGNTYSIVNLSSKESTLFFVQTKAQSPNTAETVATASKASAASSSNGKAKETTRRKSHTKKLAPESEPEPEPSPPPAETATDAAMSSSPSPPPAPTTTNKRRSTSARQSLAKTPATAETTTPFAAEATAAKTNGGVVRQPGIMASMFR
ncbi:hypothetical protein BGX23_005829 [Mortierella sp. AD031]|nr:hypothetical protein BGX23_005829 [Mortierella sp. AD031]